MPIYSFYKNSTIISSFMFHAALHICNKCRSSITIVYIKKHADEISRKQTLSPPGPATYNAGSGVVVAEPFDMELSKAYCGCGCLFLWWIIANCSCCSCDAAKTEKSINAMRACFHAWLSLLCCRLKREFRVYMLLQCPLSMSPIIIRCVHNH